MSSDSSSPGSSTQGDELDKEFAALRSAMARSRNIRILILFGAIALVVLIGYMFYSLVNEVISENYRQNLLQIAQERIEQNKDQYMSEVKKLVEHSAPILKDAFYEQTKKDMPRYTAAFARERDAFAENVTATLRTSAQEHYGRALDKYKQKMIQDIPELGSPELKEKAMQAVGVAFDRMVEKYYVKTMADGLEEIYGLWDSFPRADASQDPPEDVLIGLLLELVSKKMAN